MVAEWSQKYTNSSKKVKFDGLFVPTIYDFESKVFLEEANVFSYQTITALIYTSSYRHIKFHLLPFALNFVLYRSTGRPLFSLHYDKE